ncbi:MAG: HAMP domain-containing histidine kinase [Planctomycetes bacterium]|nr:HAMP domain-containing histidine kinase [Planctomycetota bacterium]MCH9725722.1 HAMP domain-containing histidine kinase [Planctomycetota bacterium]MCH9777777.1 HAMP domain-containing histidine kinase [Planctomycetota bacterium]MCH9792800.1 HAMP domain-containing histidine kinase [Planctomycetota bacterium]
MKNYAKYWYLVVLLIVVSCADSLLVTSGLTNPAIALVIALTASLAGWAWLVKTIQKDRDQIMACLKNPELNRSKIQHKNFFGSLFTEALQKIEHSDSELLSTKQVQTILKARLNSLIKKEMLRESVLESLDTGILIFDAQHVLEFSNSAADDFLISKADQKDTHSDSSLSLSKTLFNDTVIPELSRLLTKTIQRKDATSCRRTEFEFTSNGSTNHFCAIATNLCDENQTALGTVVVIENNGEENKEKTNHAEFVSSVAHELKTPMSGIKAYVEMLIDGECEADEAMELYGFINEQIDRLTRLVNSMLNLARIESGVVDIKRHDYELNDILKKAFDVISPTAAEKEITITTQLSDLYLPVHVDKDMLGQAIINLLSNAVKYTPNGHEVCLRSRMEESSAVIEVRDTGLGIPEDSLPHIFDRFYRVPENNRSAAGTGLGLSLVHFIVTNVHNGSISVQSKVNEGTCFIINIPLGHKEKRRVQQLAASTNV